MLLTGARWEALSWRDQLDVTEAVLCEPYSAEKAIQNLDNWVAEAYPSQETWGTQPAAAQGVAAAESAFGPQAEALTPTEREERERRKAEAAKRRAERAAQQEQAPPTMGAP